MKKVLAMLLAALCLCGAAYAQVYESTLGYSLDLPEDWRVLDANTFAEIEAAVGAEKMAEVGVSAATVGDMVNMLRASGIEYLLCLDGVGSVTVIAQPGAATKESFLVQAETMRQGLADTGVTGGVVGEAVFGANEYVALVCEVEGAMVANYFASAGGTTYLFTFESVTADVIAPILGTAQMVGRETDSVGSMLPRRD